MAYRVSNTLTTTNGNTYASTAEWISDHGPCGTQAPSVVNSSLTLLDNTSVRCVKTFNDQAAHEALKAQTASSRTNLQYTISDIVKETI